VRTVLIMKENKSFIPKIINNLTGNLSIILFEQWIKNLNSGFIEVAWPDGTSLKHSGKNPGPSIFIRVNRYRFVREVATSGSLGLADSYVNGDWDTPDLTAVLRLALENERYLKSKISKIQTIQFYNRIRHKMNANTPDGSRRNIAAHYDLGNSFYSSWLDESMTYSSGYFDNSKSSLNEAQIAKYDRMAEISGISIGENILEIGCGWGGFAIYAAKKFKCDVTAVTLSHEQAEWAREKVFKEKLNDSINIRVQDYRDVPEVFDRIISIEMFEAVGEVFWPNFFDQIKQNLVPGGSAGIQVITIDNDRLENYRKNPDFIQLRIFPGGMIPSPEVFKRALNNSGLVIKDTSFFGSSYAQTLRIWRQNFENSWPNLKQLGFDESFRRLWRYYLSYCEVGFDYGVLSVGQYKLELS